MKKRSIVFYKNAYYHFYYLAKALRRRGWDAVAVSIENPESEVNKLYHGEDINLYSSDPVKFQKNLEEFYQEALNRFDMVYFQGDHCLSFFPKYYQELIAPDILEWKRAGKRIGYIASGCLSGIAKSTIGEWSALDNGKICCEHCSYGPSICSNKRNLKWGRKYSAICDIVSGLSLPALDYMASDNIHHDPLDLALDKDIWNPDLEIPNKHLIENSADDILIYHAMANYDARTKDKKNIKGTEAIVNAVDRLRSEGHKCRLIFATGIPNTEVRFIQAQADIIVEQLHIGRWGATSREGMMLGKPVISYLNRNEPVLIKEQHAVMEMPILSAGEENIYDVLKDLVLNDEKRKQLGIESRDFALKWLDADTMAERFEKAYDIVMNNGRYDNGIYQMFPGAIKQIERDSIDYYIRLAEMGEYSESSKIDSLVESDFFKENWEEYLEYAWLYRKVPYYINERRKNPLCEFGRNFEDALVALEIGDESSASKSFQLSIQHFESRSLPFKEIKIYDYYYLIAQSFLRIKDLQSAAVYLTQAIQNNSEFTDALEQLAELFFMNGYYLKAKETMERAYFSQPTRRSILSKLAEINIKLGLPKEDMSQKESWLHQSILKSEEYIEKGELVKARNLLESLDTLFPDTLDVLNNLAVLEFLCANVESALANLHRVLQLDPTNTTALENISIMTNT